jgi:hypothetical protein
LQYLCELPESLTLDDDTNLQITAFEVRGKDMLQAHDGRLHRLGLVHGRIGLNFLFQPVHGLVRLGARGCGLHPRISAAGASVAG